MTDRFEVKQNEVLRKVAEINNQPDIQKWDIRRGSEYWGSSPTQEQAQYVADQLNANPPPALAKLEKLYPEITIIGMREINKVRNNRIIPSEPIRKILQSAAFQEQVLNGQLYVHDGALEPLPNTSPTLAAARVKTVALTDEGLVVTVIPFGNYGKYLSEEAAKGRVGELQLVGMTEVSSFPFGDDPRTAIELVEYNSIRALWLTNSKVRVTDGD